MNMGPRTLRLAAILGGLLFVLTTSFAFAQADAKADPSQARFNQVKLLSQVTEIFLNRCSECHSEDDARPKGDFGFVMDLARLAKSPDYVVPGQPDNSEMYLMIDLDDMPPSKSKFGPMPDDEKKMVHDWIKAGAFAIDSNADADVVVAPAESDSVGEMAKPAKKRLPLYYLIGKLHPFVIHFPIALIVAAGIAELFSLTQRHTGMTSAVTFCLLIGSASAVMAAISGWVFAMEQGYAIGMDTEIHNLHRWLGVACALICPVLLAIDLLSIKDRRFFRYCLLVGIALVLATGHFGGMLIYGDALFSL